MGKEKLIPEIPPDVEDENTPRRRFKALATKVLSITPQDFAEREREWNERAPERKHAHHKMPKRRHA